MRLAGRAIADLPGGGGAAATAFDTGEEYAGGGNEQTNDGVQGEPPPECEGQEEPKGRFRFAAVTIATRQRLGSKI